MTKKDNDKIKKKSSKKQAANQENFKRELGQVKLADGSWLPKEKFIEDLRARLSVATEDGNTLKQVELSKELIRLQGLTVPKPSVEGEEGELSNSIITKDKFAKARRYAEELENEVFPVKNPLLSSNEGHGNPIIQGENVVLWGGEGQGKTTFALELADKLHRGGELGYWQCLKSHVVYIDGEMGGESIRERRKQPGLTNIKESLSFINYDLVTKELNRPLALYSRETLNELFEFLKDEGAGVVILDNLGTLFPGYDVNSAADYGIISEFLRNCKAENITSILVCHANKAGAIKGSTVIGDQADISISIKNPGPVSFIDKTGKIGANFITSYEKKRRLLPNKQYEWFFPKGETSPIVKEIDDEKRIKKAISQASYNSERAIADVLQIDPHCVMLALATLTNQEEITRKRGVFKIASAY